MTRFDWWAAAVFVATVAVVVLLRFGNPLSLSHDKQAELAGYLAGLVLSAAALAVLLNVVVMKPPRQPTSRK